MKIIHLSIHRPVMISMVECFLLVLGIVGYSKIGVDLFPNIEAPIITITTMYSGAGPFEVENLVTKPIEEQVNQIGGIEQLTSVSREGISRVVIEFKLELNAKQQQIEVQNRIARVRATLPDDADEPVVQRLDFGDRPIMRLALGLGKDVGDAVTESALQPLADDVVKPRLQQVDGVGQIDVFGALQREIVVQLDRQKMLLWKLTPSAVADAVRRANVNIPGGSVKEEPRERALRLIGEYGSVSEIGDTVVRSLPGGRSVTLNDVAEVRDTFMERNSFARVNGHPVVMLEVRRQSGANTVQVADALTKRLEVVRPLLPRGVDMGVVYDGARIIKNSIYDVNETLVIAALLAFVVVYCFLGSFQSMFITGIALPTTVIATYFGLWITGFTANIMTLLGITLAVGLILDDAIVVRENIWSKLEHGMPPVEAALRGSEQVYMAVMATSLTILATFIPVAFIPGIVGRFFAAFALTVCLGVIFSTFDALTMAPMMSAYMVKGNAAQHKPNRFIQTLEYYGGYFNAGFEKMLRWSLDHPKKVLLAALLTFVGSLALVPIIGFTFFSGSENGELEVNLEGPPGTSVDEMLRVSGQVRTIVVAHPEVELTSERIGNELGDSNVASVFVRMVPMKERLISTQQMKAMLRSELNPLAREKKMILSVADAGGGGPGRPISVAIQGPDTDELIRLSEDVLRRAPLEVPGALNVNSNMKPGKDEIQFVIDRRRAAEFGMSSQEVGRAIRGLYEGELAGKFREKGDEYDIRVRLPKADRLGVAAVEGLTIPNTRDEAVPLTAVTRAQMGRSPTSIVRINQQRAALIEGDLDPGSPLADVLRQLGAMINPMLKEGYRVDFLGQAKSMRDLMTGMMISLSLGAVFVFMVMASLYESLVIPWAILLTLPLAMVGAIVALLLTGRFMDIYTVIGIILLMGLVAKNAILVVDYVEQLRAEGKNRHDALLEASLRRMRPIMMTSVAMIAGMLPVALGMSELNRTRAGMGIAAVGGMVSSTMLSLVVVPCAYIYLDNFRDWSRGIVRRIWS